MTRYARVLALAAGVVAAAAMPCVGQDNVRLVRGAGLSIELGAPLSLQFEDIRVARMLVHQQFRSPCIADIAGWVVDNPGVSIEMRLQSDAGVEIPGEGIVVVAKSGALIQGAPPPSRIDALGALLDIDGDGVLDIPLWGLEGDTDAMIVTSYMLDEDLVLVTMIEPAPRVDPDAPSPPVFIPAPPDPSYTFTTIAQLPISLFNSAARRDEGELFFRVPARALTPESPTLLEISSVTLIPSAGACNAADLDEPLGTLDFSDVTAFLAAFGAMEPQADLSFPAGVFDFSDVVAFLEAFAAGCP